MPLWHVDPGHRIEPSRRLLVPARCVLGHCPAHCRGVTMWWWQVGRATPRAAPVPRTPTGPWALRQCASHAQVSHTHTSAPMMQADVVGCRQRDHVCTVQCQQLRVQGGLHAGCECYVPAVPSQPLLHPVHRRQLPGGGHASHRLLRPVGGSSRQHLRLHVPVHKRPGGAYQARPSFLGGASFLVWV